MRIPLLLILIVTFMTAPTASAIEQDKALHYGVSLGVSTVATVALNHYNVNQSAYKGFGICMGVGLAKEIYDEIDYGGFDEKDLVADAAGCFTGSILGVTWIKLYSENDTTGFEINYKF